MAMMSRAVHLLFFLFLAFGRGENVVDYSCKATKQPPLHPYSLLMTVWIISRPSFPPSTLAPSLGADDCLANQDPCSFLAAGGCGSSCSEGVVAYIFESGPCNPNSTNSYSYSFSNDFTYFPSPLPTSQPTVTKDCSIERCSDLGWNSIA